ncbi:MAG: hypothetical protein JNJ43_08680 [Anaerolineales bacterium]|nr:hypothetical protein [Anaerolineales bacterium]
MKKNRILILTTIIVLIITALTIFIKNPQYLKVSAQEPTDTIPTLTSNPIVEVYTDVPSIILQKYAFSDIQTVTVNDFQISATNFIIRGDVLNVDICYLNPDQYEWSTGDAVIEFDGQKLFLFGGNVLETHRILENGEILSYETTDEIQQQADKYSLINIEEYNYRCETLIFILAPETKLSKVQLTIQYMRASTEGDVCNENLEKVQSMLNAKGIDIQAGCVKNEYEFTSPASFSVVKKPDSFTEEEALKIVQETFRELIRIYGPWVFSSEVIQEPKLDTTSPEAPVEESTTPMP